MTTLLFYAFQRFEPSAELQKQLDKEIVIDVVPPTIQRTKPPTPLRPVIPVDFDNQDEFPVDFPTTDEVFSNPTTTILSPPPKGEEEPVVPFAELSEEPVEIKRVNPAYPELARRAGIEGMVVVKTLINTKGDVEDVVVLKSHPLLDQAAIEAAKQFKFKPGKQRDRYVKVWMSIPFTFKLK
jgi:protein TonB